MWEVIRYCRLNVAVAPREGRVSRNPSLEGFQFMAHNVAPREGRVSRNPNLLEEIRKEYRRAPRGACE